jgi:hypothetical protein
MYTSYWKAALRARTKDTPQNRRIDRDDPRATRQTQARPSYQPNASISITLLTVHPFARVQTETKPRWSNRLVGAVARRLESADDLVERPEGQTRSSATAAIESA